MNKLLLSLLAILFLTSCADQYRIEGSTSVSVLDGSKLYLKTFSNGELKSIDSCDVVHGKFKFAGLLDSTSFVHLFMDNKRIMPLVLEPGVATISITNARQNVSGTPLNELLYEFMDSHSRLDNELEELSHRESQMMLDGVDEGEINEQLSREAAVIVQREDSLVTHFIIDNFDNVLGPGVFMILTSAYEFPILTPQIEDIMSKATPYFKGDAYVKDYYRMATENEARMNGMNMPADNLSNPSDSTIQNILNGK